LTKADRLLRLIKSKIKNRRKEETAMAVKFVSESEIINKFQEVCVQYRRYIGLIFSAPDGGKAEFGNVRIIGENDNLDHALAVARDIGSECVAIIEFDRKESAWLAARRGNRIKIIEAICGKIGQEGLRAKSQNI